jgi:hypothetical protein
MHGYEMMKALEERSGGFYAPSAGTIYPTLQMLEDRSLVTSNEADGKKVYSISDSGRAFLTEQGPREGSFAGPRGPQGPQGPGPQGPQWGRDFSGPGFGPHPRSPELQALRSEAAEVARLLMIAGRSSINNPEQLSKLRSIVENARKALSDLIYNSGATNATKTTSTTGEADTTSETTD